MKYRELILPKQHSIVNPPKELEFAIDTKNFSGFTMNNDTTLRMKPLFFNMPQLEKISKK
ncbi:MULTISPECIES: hypothetical protein [unclassified Bartonella]|uniref:hypothetical protein n=1 Tax=unclassified Bartonella TaxID=2645622 RepID=UPI0035CF1D10